MQDPALSTTQGSGDQNTQHGSGDQHSHQGSEDQYPQQGSGDKLRPPAAQKLIDTFIISINSPHLYVQSTAVEQGGHGVVCVSTWYMHGLYVNVVMCVNMYLLLGDVCEHVLLLGDVCEHVILLGDVCEHVILLGGV